jgi:predicted Fe-S protein YdhL (DUF1289 family)
VEILISPCKGICTLDTRRGFCVGCFRTSAEITDWYKLPLQEKERIMRECREREYIQSNSSISFER